MIWMIIGLGYIFKLQYIEYKIMAKRVTIMINDDLDKKLRSLQAKRIQSENSSVSYSRVLNDCVRKGLK